MQPPRPASAWLLVTVAGACLWITGELAVWAIAVQGLAIGVSLVRRTRPFEWQRRALPLNLGLGAIVAATIAIAFSGVAATTIPLAHFAALTQGLQLCDARPRKTEFLLVTFATFQVILAANLTDSVFFIPLVVATLLATVWTLLVHTLRTEALEAGELASVPRAITPGLLRTTLVASGLSLVLALGLFVTLPRLRSSVVQGGLPTPGLSTAGFSESVELGTLGRIRQDPTIVLRVKTVAGDPPRHGAGYWRGLAFDRFDGRTWSITPPGRNRVAGSAEIGIDFGSGRDEANLVQRIVREPVAGGVLFGVGRIRRLQGTVRRLERDASGGLYAADQGEHRVRYTIATRRREWRDEDLRRDRARPPRDGARTLQRVKLSEEVNALARRIAEGSLNDADRVRAIETYLLRNGRYTDSPPDFGGAGDASPIEAFLLNETAGHCEYFASAMVLLARELGLPARLVNGFAGGRENRIGGFIELSRSDAHAWVEVHYEDAGWVRYDPTPPDLRIRHDSVYSGSTLHQLGSALEYWWFQRVVGFDRSDQMQALKSAWLAWKRVGRDRESVGQPSPGAWPRIDAVAWREMGGLIIALGAAVVLFRRTRGAGPPPHLHPDYAEALRLLARLRLERTASATPRDFARRVATSLPVTGPAFSAVTEGYQAHRFGGRRWHTSNRDLRALRDALRRDRP